MDKIGLYKKVKRLQNSTGKEIKWEIYPGQGFMEVLDQITAKNANNLMKMRKHF